MRVLDLFSGVGMFAYGMQQAGHEIAAFCEIEPWPRRVLAKHWSDVPIYEDVRELNRERLEKDGVISYAENTNVEESPCAGWGSQMQSGGGCWRDGIPAPCQKTNRRSIDIITGGFPCQDLSVAGKQAGIKGERSGLFDEIVRLASELRPRYIVLENVAALLTGDSGGWARYIFGSLAEIGLDAEWHVIPAGNPNGLSAGAPHRRERVWIVAYPNNFSGRPQPNRVRDNINSKKGAKAGASNGTNSRETGGKTLADTERQRQQGQGEFVEPCSSAPDSDRQTGQSVDVSEPRIGPTEPHLDLLANGIAARLAGLRWLPEPGIARVATGVPDRVQKLKALGNGLVWQIPYAIGCAINDREAA